MVQSGRGRGLRAPLLTNCVTYSAHSVPGRAPPQRVPEPAPLGCSGPGIPGWACWQPAARRAAAVARRDVIARRARMITAFAVSGGMAAFPFCVCVRAREGGAAPLGGRRTAARACTSLPAGCEPPPQARPGPPTPQPLWPAPSRPPGPHIRTLRAPHPGPWHAQGPARPRAAGARAALGAAATCGDAGHYLVIIIETQPLRPAATRGKGASAAASRRDGFCIAALGAYWSEYAQTRGDMEGHGGTWRDMKGHEGDKEDIRRDMEGTCTDKEGSSGCALTPGPARSPCTAYSPQSAAAVSCPGSLPSQCLAQAVYRRSVLPRQSTAAVSCPGSLPHAACWHARYAWWAEPGRGKAQRHGLAAWPGAAPAP